MRISLVAKLVFAAVVALTVSNALSGIFSFGTTKDFVAEEIQSGRELQAKRMAEQIPVEIAQKDLARLKLLVNSAKEGIDEVYVINRNKEESEEDGKILAARGPQKIGEIYVRHAEKGDVTAVVKWGPEGEGVILGEVVLIFNQKATEQARNKIALQIALNVSISVLLFGIFIFLTLKYLLRGLEALRIASEAVERGNLSISLPTFPPKDELGRAFAQFSSLIRQLATLLPFCPPEAARIVRAGGRLVSRMVELTVGSMDGVGFTNWLGNLTAEEATARMNLYFTFIETTVSHFGGVIDKYIGDGILVLFGLSRKDSKERDAVKAMAALSFAVELVNWWLKKSQGLDDKGLLSFRTGIATGQCLIGPVGSLFPMGHKGYTIMGMVANLSSRLEGLREKNPPGGALMDPATHQKMGGFARVKQLPPQQIKGLPEQITPYAIEGLADADEKEVLKFLRELFVRDDVLEILGITTPEQKAELLTELEKRLQEPLTLPVANR